MENQHYNKLSAKEKLVLEALVTQYPVLLEDGKQSPDSVREGLAKAYLTEDSRTDSVLYKYMRAITGRPESTELQKPVEPRIYTQEELDKRKAEANKAREEVLKQLRESKKTAPDDKKPMAEGPKVGDKKPPVDTVTPARSGAQDALKQMQSLEFNTKRSADILLPVAQKMSKETGVDYIKAAEELLLDHRGENRDQQIFEAFTQRSLKPPVKDSKIDTQPIDLVIKLVKENDGVFLGENHAKMDARNLITKNMDKLKAAGVDTIFIEINDEWIDDIRQGPEKRKDSIVHKQKLSINGIQELIAAADKAGIKVRGHDKLIPEREEAGISSSNIREMVRRDNFSEAFIKKNKGAGKYIMLGGSAHSGNYPETEKDRGAHWGHAGIPYRGIDTRLGIPSVDFDGERLKPGVYKGDGASSSYFIVFPEENEGIPLKGFESIDPESIKPQTPANNPIPTLETPKEPPVQVTLSQMKPSELPPRNVTQTRRNPLRN